MKRKKLKIDRKKMIIIIIALAVFATLSAIISAVLTNGVKENPYGAEKVVSIKELAEKNGCEYISDSKSSVEGFDIDIYLKFGKDPIVDGLSSQAYYESVFSSFAYETGFKNLRLIDELRNIEVKIKCSDGYITSVLINDSERYFDELMSENAKKNPLKVETLDIEVNSVVLQALINNGWKTSNLNLGTKESNFDKYDIYFDEGFEIKKVNKKVFNIVFTKKYAYEVIGGIKVGADLAQIKERFGESYTQVASLGYKTKDFYVFFSDDEISIYPNFNYDSSTYTEFEKLVETYNEDQDLNAFMDQLTDIWPDYDSYEYDTSYLSISYALKGVKISFNQGEANGIKIYENYNGNLKQEQRNYKNVYYCIDENLMSELENIRPLSKRLIDNSGITEDPLHYSNKFYFTAGIAGDYYKNVKIISIDGMYPNNELDDTILVDTFIWADDSHLIYSIAGKGIYMYNAVTRKIDTLITGEETYKIKNFERETKILEYDGKKVLVNY